MSINHRDTNDTRTNEHLSLMIDLNDYFYFVHIVEKGGFAVAGRALDIPKSRLSRRIRQLEDRLGAQLIQRSSRRFVVTDLGRDFYTHARAMLDDVEAAEATVERQTNALAGRVRFSCSIGMAQFGMRELVARFLVENPKIDIVQQVTNQSVDLIKDGVDIAVRGHMERLPDSSLMQNRLATVSWRLFASPDYLEREGVPSHPENLETHVGLKLGWRPEHGQWLLRNEDDATVTIPFSPRLCSDDMVTLKKAALDGLGIVALPDYVCRAESAAGGLVEILSDWSAGEADISMLLPTRQGVMPAVQAFADCLRAELPKIISRRVEAPKNTRHART